MIPADLTAELSRALRVAAEAGELPEIAATLSAAGTWRQAPERGSRRPGAYATSLPLALAARAGLSAREIAERLASDVRAVAWIGAATVTGPGYLTISVTTDHMASVAARTVAAGREAARSGALADTWLHAPALPDLASAPDWLSAWRAHRDAVLGRIAEAAGARVTLTAGPAVAVSAVSAVSAAPGAADSPVATAVASHGTDAVRYVLTRTASRDAAAIERALDLRRDLANPFMAVRYAHADAASVARWAADLDLVRPPGLPDGGTRDRPNALHARELDLLDEMSWLGERTAAAARRGRPAQLAAYLEGLASAWMACAQDCPALPFRGRAAPADPRFRLLLAAGTRVALAAGLRLLAVTAPDRV